MTYIREKKNFEKFWGKGFKKVLKAWRKSIKRKSFEKESFKKNLYIKKSVLQNEILKKKALGKSYGKSIVLKIEARHTLRGT